MSDEIFLDGIRFVSTARAAKKTSLSRDYIYRLSKAGKLLGRRIDKHWYVDSGSLETFLAEQEEIHAKKREELSHKRAEEYKLKNPFERTSQGMMSGGTRYIPSAEAAEDSGLTRDYVYRLCKDGKLKGKLVGNIWYVDYEKFQEFLLTRQYNLHRRSEDLSRARTSEYQKSVSATEDLQVSEISPYTPSTEFFHKLVALTLTLVLTLGAYALVDPHFARFALESMQGRANAVLSVGDSFHALMDGAQSQVATIAEDPKAALAASASVLGDGVPKAFAHLASALSSGISRIVYAIASPSKLIRPFATANSGVVAVQVLSYKPSEFNVSTSLPATKNISQTIINQPVIERVIERVRTEQSLAQFGGITPDILNRRLNELDNKLSSEIFAVSAPQSSAPSIQNVYREVALSQKIDNLSGTTLSNVTVHGVSGLTDADIPDNITVAGASGGTPGGSDSQVQFNEGGAFAGVSSFTFSSSTQQLAVTNASITNSTSTNLFASNAQFGSLSLLNALGIDSGGTGTSTAPTYGKLLIGNSSGSYDLVATSSLGITGGGGPTTWGSILGTLSDQTDLQAALDAKLSLSAWYGTTTNALAEGSNNLYFTTNRVASVIAGTTTSALAEGNNLYFTNNRVATVIAGTTTDALAQGNTNKYYSSLLFASDLAGTSTDALKEGITNLYFTNPRVQTYLDSLQKGYFFATTSTDYWKTVNNFFSTTSSSYFLSQNQGPAFSTSSVAFWETTQFRWATTSTDYWKTVNNFFSTTSASAFLALNQGSAYSTTSANYWLTTKTTDNLSQGSTNKYYSTLLFASDLAGTTTDAVREGVANLYFTNDRVASVIAGTTTSALAEGNNLYFTTNRVASVIAGTTTEALREGATNLFYQDARVNSFIAGSTTIPKTFASNTFTGTNTFANVTLGNGTSTAFFSTVASSTNLFSSTAQFGSLSLLSALPVANGGTGTSSVPTYGKILVGNAASGYDLMSTSSLGLLSSVSWGSILGTLSNQTDLQAALDAKLSLTSWYATTTDGLREGTTNLYFTNPRVQTYLDSLAKGYFFATTSADYWKTVNNFFSTTSASAFLALNQGPAFSTSSASYFLSQNQGPAFSTSSVAFWETTQFRWATTSTDYWKTVNNFFSTTSANYFVGSSTTIPKTFTSNAFSALQTFQSGLISQASSTFTGLLNLSQASTTQLTNSGNTYFTGLTSKLLATDQNGLVVGTTSIGVNFLTGTLGVANGGTGSTTLTGLLKGNGVGGILSAIAGTDYLTVASLAAAYPFSLTGNATSTLTQFNGGLTAYASSTIGSGSQAGGLTISGGATTTGNAYFANNLGIGTTTPGSIFSINNVANFVTSATSSIYGALQTQNHIPAGPYTNNLAGYDLGATSARWNALWAGTLNVGTSTFSLKSDANSNLGFFTAASGGGTQALTITSTGNVGIGTLNPGEKLEVVGNIISKGTSWTSRTSTSLRNWSAVAYGNGLFVALAQDGTTANQIMTSSDGITWTARTSPSARIWSAVTYGNGLFVAVATDGTTATDIMTSPDGITWTSRTSPSASAWRSVTYGNGTFAAVASDGSVMTSLDGTTWTSRTAASARSWWSLTYGNGLFVAVATDGTTATDIMTSPDGITWTSRTSPTANQWSAVAYGNGLFVALAFNGTTADQIMTSPDGITWTSRTSPSARVWSTVTYGNGLFVAVAQDGTTANQVITSPDGITWTSRTDPVAGHWLSVSYGNGLFAAVASLGTLADQVMTSGKTDYIPFSSNNIFQGGMGIFGNVGIGTTTPQSTLVISSSGASSTPNLYAGTQLDLFNPTAATGQMAGLRLHTASGWNVQLRTVQNDNWLELTDAGGNVNQSWNGTKYYPGASSNNGANTGYISGNGTNIGIGTVSPRTRLQTLSTTSVASMTLGNPTGVGLTVSAAGDNNYGLNVGVNSDGTSWIQNGRLDGTATAYNMSLQASGGNVGIGATSLVAGAKLDVRGTINLTAGTKNWFIGENVDGGNVGKFMIRQADNGYNAITVENTAGNVGIGNTSPGTKLDVSDTGNNEIPVQFHSSASSNYSIIRAYNNNTSYAADFGVNPDGGIYERAIRNVPAGSVAWSVSHNGGSTAILTALGNGNVGIGTSPGTLLDVNGVGTFRSSPTAGASTYLQLGGTDSGGNTLMVFPNGTAANDTAFLRSVTSANNYDLRLYLQDDQDDTEKFSVWGGSCGNGGCDLGTSNAIEQFHVTAAGNGYFRGSVGLGVSPSFKLHVNGSVGFQGISVLGTETLVPLCYNSGTFEVKRSTAVNTCDGADGDVAENFGTEETVHRGEIVSLGNSIASRDYLIKNPDANETASSTYTINTAKVRLARAGDRGRIVGAIPTAPFKIGSDEIKPEDGPRPVAIAGHVPVKMTLDGGDIAIGDPITVSYSHAGWGAKATTTGRIVGWALEDFNAAATSSDGMIEVYVSPQDWVAPLDLSALIDLSKFGATSTQSDIVVQDSFIDGFLQHLMSHLVAWFADAENGIGDVFARALHAKDEICVDDQCLTKDDVRALLQLAHGQTATASSPASSGVGTGSVASTTGVNASSTAPIIEINGNNPSTLIVGDLYTDLGASITGPTAADQNLGIHTFVDGVAMDTVFIDTSKAGTYGIDYVASNAAGTATSTRVVIVQNPTSSTSTSTPNSVAPGAATSSNDWESVSSSTQQ